MLKKVLSLDESSGTLPSCAVMAAVGGATPGVDDLEASGVPYSDEGLPEATGVSGAEWFDAILEWWREQ